jgi:protein TonB
VTSASPAPRTPDAAPGTPGARPAQPVADVTVLTSHDDFLLELGEALSGQAAIHPVDSLQAAIEGVTGGRRTQVLVIDARAVEDVPAAVDQAHSAHPRLAVLVFAESELKKQLAEVRRQKHFAVLSTPIDPLKARSVLERAITAAVASKASADAAAPEPTAHAPQLQPARAPTETFVAAGKSPLLLVGGATLLLAVLAAAGFWFFHAAPAPQPHAAAAAVPAPVAETSILKGKVDELLEKARLAMHERRFAEPNGDNALVYYRSALAADPGNAEARDGLSRVAGALTGRFEEALTASRFEEAALTLANFKIAAPEDVRANALEQRLYAAEIARALADGNSERASGYLRQAQQSSAVSPDLIGRWRAEIVRRQEDARVQQLGSLVEDRIRDGHLNDGEDSARAYLGQLTSSAPASPVTEHASRELINADLRRAREAALAKNNADAERWLGEARALGLKPAELAAFQKDLSGARQKAVSNESEHSLQLARERVQDGRLTDPAQDSAAYYLTQVQTGDPANAGLADASHALAQALLGRARGEVLAGKPADADLAQARQWGADPADIQAVQQLQPPPAAGAVDPATLAENLKRTRTVAPDYPPEALTRRLTGTVTMQFTVDKRGVTRDVRVVEATSPGVFDQAAISAVRSWRYQPLLVNGSAVEVPVTTRVRFELPK